MMRWTRLAACVLVVWLAQRAVIGLLGWTWLDLFAALALLYGVRSPTNEARLSAWLIGLAQDMGSADAFGIHAFCLGLSGMLITRLRDSVDLRVPPAAAIVGAVGLWAGQCVFGLHSEYWSGTTAGGLGGVLLRATVTACVAGLIGLAALLWMQRSRRARTRRW